MVRLAATILLVALASTAGSAASEPDTAGLVIPIDWTRFKLPADFSNDYHDAAKLLLGCARYGSGWLDANYKIDPAGSMYVVEPPSQSGGQEFVVRAPASTTLALAVVLKTGIFDEQAVGATKPQTIERAVRAVKGVAAVHKVNRGDSGWGDHWQSAMWTSFLGQAGWMLWDDLDDDARRWLAEVVRYEADRFIAPDYRVPYWANREGYVTPSDTKAEENSWNAMILQIAVAMMPAHPHAAAWRRVASELMVSAFAMPRDMDDRTTTIDGRSLADWLHGYNVREDGAVVNHGRVHPDYAAAIVQNARSFVVQSLAGQNVPESADFNAALVFRTLVTHHWPSPPYEKPGGTIYVPGKAELYYPNGTDWSAVNFPDIYVVDVNAHLLGWDAGLPRQAAAWMRLRAARMLAMQARHADGRLYAKGEFDTYPHSEAVAAQVIADSFLLHWLHAAGAIRGQKNWNE
jgi:hypothetical protein